MSNGFVWHPVKNRYLDTGLNNWFHEQLEQTFGYPLPIKLNRSSIAPLRAIAKKMADSSAVEKLIEAIDMHGEISIKRDSGWD